MAGGGDFPFPGVANAFATSKFLFGALLVAFWDDSAVSTTFFLPPFPGTEEGTAVVLAVFDLGGGAKPPPPLPFSPSENDERFY